MLLGPKANITIVSDVSFFTAVYARVYQMSVEAKDEAGSNAIITVTSYDKVPSGYRAGGSEQILLESEEMRVPDKGTMKQWLAQLALEHDRFLKERTGCKHFNESLIKIQSYLEGAAE